MDVPKQWHGALVGTPSPWYSKNRGYKHSALPNTFGRTVFIWSLKLLSSYNNETFNQPSLRIEIFMIETVANRVKPLPSISLRAGNPSWPCTKPKPMKSRRFWPPSNQPAFSAALKTMRIWSSSSKRLPSVEGPKYIMAHLSGLQSLISDHIQLRVLQMKLLGWLSSQLPPFIPNIETWTAQCPGHCQWRRSPVALFPLEPDASRLHSRWSRSRSLGGSAEKTPGDVDLWGMATERNGNES